jgi:hypothetical protein
MALFPGSALSRSCAGLSCLVRSIPLSFSRNASSWARAKVVLFEDENLLVVNKPGGLVVQVRSPIPLISRDVPLHGISPAS